MTTKPNVFLAVDIDNPVIITKMQEVLYDCFAYDSTLRNYAVPMTKAHITLMVTNVQEEDLPKARAVIEKCLKEHVVRDLINNQFKVEVKGVNSFGSRVVFAEVAEGESNVKNLNGVLVKAFQEAGFHCDSRYSPHVTLMKVR